MRCTPSRPAGTRWTRRERRPTPRRARATGPLRVGGHLCPNGRLGSVKGGHLCPNGRLRLGERGPFVPEWPARVDGLRPLVPEWPLWGGQRLLGLAGGLNPITASVNRRVASLLFGSPVREASLVS